MPTFTYRGIMAGGGTLAVWLWPEWGSRGPWLFATAFVVCVGLTLWLRWRLGPWEQFDVIGRGESAETEVRAIPGMETLVSPLTEGLASPLAETQASPLIKGE